MMAAGQEVRDAYRAGALAERARILAALRDVVRAMGDGGGAMMDCVILYRVNGGPVQIVGSVLGGIAVYPDRDAAIEYADSKKLAQSGQADYQIVELDEL